MRPMPFTPFHMGPGLAVKAVGGRRFSLMVFGFAQVAIDLEPLVRLLRGDGILHGFSHTWIGGTLVAVVSVFAGRPICQRLLGWWKPREPSSFEAWLRGPERISWTAAISGAVVGAYSHVILDSIMHSDMRPLAPFSNQNGLIDLIGVEALHIGCILSGVLGAAALGIVFLCRAAARAT
jgi:hypothetical protein